MLHSLLMRTARTGAIALTAVLALVPASAQTLDEVIAKHLDARGGLDKIKAVKTARLTGRMTMGPGMEAPVIMEWKRPSAFRMEFTIQGMTGVQAYDGALGWQVMPFMGKPDAEKMTAEDMSHVEEQADLIEGELIDWKAKGHQVELIGKETLEGTEAFKLKVTRKNGDTKFLWIDADAWLEIKGNSKRTMRGQEMEMETTTSDYKEVGGLIMPHSFAVTAVGQPVGQTLTFDKIEFNVDLDDARFKMPAPKPAAADPAAGKKPEAAPPAEKKPAGNSK